MSTFSQRHGYSSPAKEITIREAAPESIRVVALEAAHSDSWSLDASSMRDIVCRILRKRQDSNNWSAGNIWREVQDLVHDCDWFKVYDIIEAFYAAAQRQGDFQKSYAQAINDCFIEEGIGWQLLDGKIVARGDEGFQRAVNMAASQLQENQRPTAASNIQSNT